MDKLFIKNKGVRNLNTIGKYIFVLIWIFIIPFAILEGLKYGKGGVKRILSELIADIKSIIKE